MIHFETLSWLYAIVPVVAVLALLFFLANRSRASALRTFASANILQSILTSYSSRRRRIKEVLFILAAVLLLLALARPQYGYEWRETRGRGIDVLFAIDVSRSMLAEDIQPNRLTRARIAVEDFVSRLDGDRVGLIAFAGDAFLLCPLTLDYNAFLRSLDALNPDVISRGGTDIAAAIETADAAFKQKQNYRILILLSDGEDLGEEGIEAARKAAADDMRIFTVGLGSPGGAPIPVANALGQVEFVRDQDGAIVQSRLDAETLQSIANITSGFYLPLGRGNENLDRIYTQGLADIPREELESNLQKVPLERFQWPLALAILCLAIEPLLGTRKLRLDRARHAVLPVGLLVAGSILVHPQHAHAASTAQAWNALQDGRYEEAKERYHQLNAQAGGEPTLLFNEAVATYFQGNLQEASALLKRALPSAAPHLQQRIHYNLGVIDYRLADSQLEQQELGQAILALEQAEKEFLNALDIRPDDARAQHNLALTRQKLEELNKQQQQQQQQEQSSDSQQQDNPDGEQSPESSDSGQQQDSQDSSQSGQEQQQQEQGSSDPSEQPTADSEEGASPDDSAPSPEQSTADADSGADKNESQPSGAEEDESSSAMDGSNESAAQEEPSEQATGESADAAAGEESGQEEIAPTTDESSDPQQDSAESASQLQRPAAMTREEARMMLDTLREQQRFLPYSPGGRGSPPSLDQRDW